MSTSSVFDSLYSNYTSRYDTSKYSNDYDSGRKSAYNSSPYSAYSTSYSSSYSTRYPTTSSSNTNSSSLSSPSYDKYYNYLDDLTSSRRRNSSDLKYALPSSYSSSSLRSNKYLDNSFASTSSSSNNNIGSGSSNVDIVSGLAAGPKYDQFGKELSNYDRWRLRNFGGGDKADDSSGSKYRSRLTTNAAKEESPLSKDSVVLGSRYGTNRSSSILPGPSSSSSYRSSFGSSTNTVRNFPTGVADKLSSYDVHDVRGDGGCYYRCLSLFFSGSEDNYMKYRREVMAYIRENVDNYSSMIKSELGRSSSTSDYFSRKMRADRQDWAETTEIIATCCVYDINVHVLALVPGRRSTWEWLHFDPSIGTGKPSHATRDIFLYNQGSVHFMLCKPK